MLFAIPRAICKKRILLCYTVPMLTNKEKMHVYAYWQRGVKRGVYLKDIEPGHLSTEALLHLIPSALYCKYDLLEIPKSDMKIGHFGRNCEILHDTVARHQANIAQLTP